MSADNQDEKVNIEELEKEIKNFEETGELPKEPQQTAIAGQQLINLRTQIPMQLVERCLMLQAIREIGVDKILQLKNERFRVFLLQAEFEDGTSEWEIDWEFCIFAATSYQWEKLMECFYQPKQPATPPIIEDIKPSIITESDIRDEDRPPLTIA